MTTATRTTSYFTTRQHERLRDQVRDFAEVKVAPRVGDMEAAKSVHVELSRLIAQQGWLGVTIDPRYGGMGLGHLAKTIIIEELSRVSGAMGAMVQASQLGVAKIVHFGNEQQKRRWLPMVSDGRCMPTIAVTEPESGGHVLGMSATAERVGNEYFLNGRKVFVGNSHVGDLHGVVMRTGPGSRGLSAFLVDSSAPGLSLGRHQPAMGLHGFSFGELIFENCRVPAENLLGSEGDGLAVAYSSSVLYGRPNLTAVSLGIHRAIVEQTLEFATRHGRYGKSLADLPTVRQKLGQMQSQLMTARLAAYHAAHLLDEGMPCDAELISAKLLNVESSLDSARTAMEVHAAHGLYPDSNIERFLRDANHIYAPAGTSDIQRIRLAEVALGTYREQWSARFSEQLRASSGLLNGVARAADEPITHDSEDSETVPSRWWRR
ncbi:acyl-CoA dehydrogenase family protein [Actinophytocola algeriensis]|uniref:Alkylation response protein AidB-like acyl-CoA dehydrogenase n=1 Tax=Actinophytocola algeriensis TaxID=1768010 RepID=A0A7W7VCB6_9PSEU|nr:acyl-CoA dehydrogenase family protein [Actinophytocola algeriensis]MBB4905008.1 alkylation response protein AidB-like acyl-CoA dehydrogenase [Actinophytocola algeriensis]MBE1476132.1 alkylation response protein AidB-like acyl-CoA dehydrogenase [Actinophytocola algeriensis]